MFNNEQVQDRTNQPKKQASQTTYTPDCIKNLETSSNPFEHKFNPKIKALYYLLVHKLINKKVIQAEAEEWGERFGVTGRNIRQWLHFFEDRKLIKIVGGGPGRGRKLQIKLTGWLVERIQKERKRVKNTPKNRIDQLEREYLKSQSQPGKTTENGNKAYKQPKYKDTLKDQVRENSKDPPPSTFKERQEALKKLDDDFILIKTKPEYGWVMEEFRHICWTNGCKRSISDIICNLIGKLIDGKRLGFARNLARWLIENIKKILKNLLGRADQGIRALYQIANGMIRKGLGLLKTKSKPRTKRFKWDLNDPKERREFMEKAAQIARSGGGTCPRCGKQITQYLWAENPGMAFKDKELCICIYIARDREITAREEKFIQRRAESQKPKDWSLSGKGYTTVREMLTGSDPDHELGKKIAVKRIKEFKRKALREAMWSSVDNLGR